MAKTSDLRKLFERGKKQVRKVNNTKAGSWGANALRSLGYSSLDVIKSITPNMAEMAESAVETSKELRETLMEAKSQNRSLKDALDKNLYVGTGKEWFKNALEDLKSGKLNNRQREKELQDAEWGLDDFDFDDGFDDDGFEDFDDDFGDDFGDDDFDEDFEDDIVSSDGGASASFATKSKRGNTVTQVAMYNNIGPDSPIVQATEGQTEVLIRSSEISTNTTIASTQALLQMSAKIGKDITSLLATMGDTMSDMNSNVTKVLGDHQALSAQYYSDSMGVQNSILEEIKQIRETVNTQLAATAATTVQEKKRTQDVLSMFSNGMIDPRDYAGFVKKNIQSAIESNFVTASLQGIISDEDNLKSIAANPLSFIPSAIVKGIIPSVMKTAAKQLDKSIGEFAITALSKIGSMGNDYNLPEPLRLIGRIFGIQNTMKTKVDQSNYEKGPVPWDGISRRTLNDVIPMYLSQIAAAVTGTEQMVFDYDKGTYTSLRKIKEERERSIENSKTAPFFDDIMQFNEMVNKQYTDKSADEIKQIKDTFRNMIINHVDRGGGGTYRVKHTDEGDEDYLAKISNLYTGDPTLELIRGYFEGRQRAGDKAANMAFFGRSAQEAIHNVTSMTENMERDPIRFNAQYIDSGLDDVTNSHIQSFKDGTIALRGTGGPFADKYGKRPAEYLRDILIRLNKGILVEVSNGLDIGGSGRRRRRGGGPPAGPSDIKKSSSEFLDKASTEERDYQENIDSRSGRILGDNIRYESDLERGKVDVKSVDSSETATAVAQEYHTQRLEDDRKEAGDKSILAKMAKFLPPGMSKVLLSWDSHLQNLGNTISGGINKANDFLYTVLFGKEDGTSVMKDIISRLKATFDGFNGFLKEKILVPADEALFGDEGLFTKLGETQFAQDVKDAVGNMKEKIFGTPTTDENGRTVYEGGLLSDTMTELRNMGSNVKSAIFGGKDADGNKIPLDQDTSIFGSIKRMGLQVGDYMSKAMGLDKKDPDDKTTLSARITAKLDTTWGLVKDRFSQWSDMILGPKVDENGQKNLLREGIASFREDMKGQGGAVGAGAVVGGVGGALLGGHLGLLSSLFLPGGPIGGALLGAGIAMVNKSETLKTVIFGPEDDSGERTGGIISKDIQNFFKDNKTGISVGAFAGLAGSMGIIPAMFVPGGPVGGALIGGALSMATKTEAFQEFMYGEGGTKDDPTGGLMKKVKDAFGKNKDTKGLALDAGVGAGVGLVGSFFLPGGPITGALIGSAINIGLNTEKFKTFMFGKETFDEEGNSKGRKGGLFGKVTDFVSTQIFKPLAKTAQAAQIKMIGFVEREMIAPLLSALSPITNKLEEVGISIKDGVTGVFKSIGDKFHETITKPIGEALEPYIDKMKQVLSKIFGGLFKAIGAVVSSPFKMIGAVGTGIFERDKKRGADAATSEELQSIFDLSGRKERGEKMGLFSTTAVDENGNKTKVGRGLFGRLIHAYSKENRTAGAYSDKGAGKYATEEKNPYTIRDDYIAKSLAKEQEKLATLNKNSKSGSLLNRISDWLNTKSSTTTTPSTSSGNPAFIEIYNSLVDAGVDNPGEMALSILAIETDDVPGTVAKLLGNEPETKKSKKKSPDKGKKGKKKDEQQEEEQQTKIDTPETVATAVAEQTNRAEEHHKESINIIETIKERVESLVEYFESKKQKDDKEETDTTVPSTTTQLPPMQQPEQSTGSPTENTQTRPQDSDQQDDDTTALSKRNKRSIAQDVSRISDSVYGQLNGVGYNINKIYHLLLDALGTSDENIQGENNKQHVGFWGKIRTMLNNPIKMVTNVLMTPVRLIEGALNKVGNVFSSVGHFLADTAKGLWNGVKQFGAGVLQAGLSLLQLPVELTKLLGTVAKNLLPVVKETLVGGIKIATSVLTEGVHFLGTALVEGTKAIGEMVGAAARGFGELLGGALSGLGNLLYGAGLIGKEVLKGVAKGIGGAFKFAGKAFMGMLTTGANVVGNILGGLFGGGDGKGLFGKRTMDVYVIGGTLDEVTYVKEDDPDCQNRTIENFNTQTNKIIALLEALVPVSKNPMRDSSGGVRNTDWTKRRMNLRLFGYKDAGQTNSGTDSELINYLEQKDEKEAEEEKEKQEKEEYETRVAEGSTASQREDLAAEDKEEAEERRQNGILAKLSDIFAVNKEHHSGWSSVFGLKTGMITLGLIALAPLIIKLLPFIKNVLGFIKDKLVELGPIFQNIAAFIGKFVGEMGGELIEQGAEGLKNEGGIAGVFNNAEEVLDDNTKVFTGEGNEVVVNKDGTVEVEMDSAGNPKGLKKRKEKLSAFERAKSVFARKDVVIDTDTGEAHTVYKPNTIGTKGAAALIRTNPLTKNALRKATVAAVDPVIKKFVECCKPIFLSIGDDLVKFLTQHGLKIGALTGIKQTFKELAEKLFNVTLLGPMLKKITEFMGKFATKTATSVYTVLIAEAVYFTIGAFVANPAQVFHVNREDVDWKMQLIARFFKGLLATTPGSVFDFVNELAYTIIGTDFLCVIASAAYNCFGEDAKKMLDAAQAKLREEYRAYQHKEYTAYAENAAKNNKPALTEEQFIQSELATSEQEYIRAHNRTALQKAGDATFDAYMNTSTKIQESYQRSDWAKEVEATSKSGAWQRDEQYGGFGEGDSVTFSAPSTINGVPYFSQYDPKYKDENYNLSDGSRDTIANRGCGPAAMAMIGNAYGAKTDPKEMADMATNSGYSTDIGTDPRFFNSASQKLGLKPKEMEANQENLTTALVGGSPILIQGRDDDPYSPFTSKGHYVVGTRLANGTGVAINDPRGPEFSKVYPMNTVIKGAAKMWSFNGGQSIPSTEETSGGFGIGTALMDKAKFNATDLQGMVTPEKVVKIAAAEVGYIEKASNSQLDIPNANPGDANYTKYNQCVGSNPQYWCAAFVCWCFEQACNGDKEKLKQLLCGSKSAACNSLMSQFKGAGRFDKNPKIGDQIFFSGSRHSGANHIGIVVGVDSQNVYTVEGNTSGNAGVVDNGGEVAFKSYALGSERILGYGHPAYDGETNFGGIVGEGQLATAATGASSTAYSYGSSDGSSGGLLGGLTGVSGFLSNIASGIGNVFMKALGFKVDDDTTTTAGSLFDTASGVYSSLSGSAPSTSTSGISGNTNTEKIWNYFTGKGFTKEGIAGLMGNMEEESGFAPNNMQNSYESKLGMNDQSYTAGVDNGTYNNFVKDSVGYGLAQWTYSGRKKNLLDYVKSRGTSIGDLGTQLDFLDHELQTSYPTVYNTLKTSRSVQDASDVVLTQFEQPADQSQNMKNKRGGHAKKWYDTYKDMEATPPVAQPQSTGAAQLALSNGSEAGSKLYGMGGFGGDTDALATKAGIVGPAPREVHAVPFRREDRYGGFGTVVSDTDRIVDLLRSIAYDTSSISDGITDLNDKEFPVVKPSQTFNITEGGDQTNVTNNNVQSGNSNSAPFQDDTDSLDRDYLIAKRLAQSLL